VSQTGLIKRGLATETRISRGFVSFLCIL